MNKYIAPLCFIFVIAVIGNVQAATVTKTAITQTSVTPTSATAGTMFKFSATLNVPLTTGNKVKIDLGKGLASMTGTRTSYSLSRAIFTTGSQTYKVGIYNAKNVLQGKVSSGNYTVSSSTNNAPTLTLVNGDNSVEQNKVYTLQLKATNSDNNLRSITVDWKDGTKAETQTSTNDTPLTFTHVYNKLGKFELSATAVDNGRPNLTSTVLLKTIEITAPIDSPYTKICNSGALEGEEDCPINPVLGNKANDWACTQDNKTGLMWEVKTTDGGLRDMNKRYSNFAADFGAEMNADSFVFDVNSQSLCGASGDWRMPTKDELLGIIKLGVSYGTLPIDTAYFPNTQRERFWSSSPVADDSYSAWYVVFDDGGYSFSYSKGGYYDVRLVRNAQ
ncbi:MAG: DUF1566 domain-containing protein [Methylococcaceae bacterium]